MADQTTWLINKTSSNYVTNLQKVTNSKSSLRSDIFNYNLSLLQSMCNQATELAALAYADTCSTSCSLDAYGFCIG